MVAVVVVATILNLDSINLAVRESFFKFVSQPNCMSLPSSLSPPVADTYPMAVAYLSVAVLTVSIALYQPE